MDQDKIKEVELMSGDPEYWNSKTDRLDIARMALDAHLPQYAIREILDSAYDRHKQNLKEKNEQENLYEEVVKYFKIKGHLQEFALDGHLLENYYFQELLEIPDYPNLADTKKEKNKVHKRLERDGLVLIQNKQLSRTRNGTELVHALGRLEESLILWFLGEY